MPKRCNLMCNPPVMTLKFPNRLHVRRPEREQAFQRSGSTESLVSKEMLVHNILICNVKHISLCQPAELRGDPVGRQTF